jgi:phospholipid transport system transporter-binding protein
LSAPARETPLELLPAEAGFALRGGLTLGQVGPWRDRGRAALAAVQGEHLHIGLGGLTRVDSAGLALLVDWIAWARGTGRTLAFLDIPPALQALARLSGLEALLAGQAAAAAASEAPPAGQASPPG